MMYELLLAQSMASVLGNTVLRYNMTIGMYIVALGLGMFCYRKFKLNDEVQRLIHVEALLSIIGTLSPFLILGIDWLANAIVVLTGASYHGAVIQSGIFIADHFLVFIIGFLSGFELPLLMDIGQKFHKNLKIKVLAIDYVGMMAAALMFPLVLLPTMGIFFIAGLVGLLNALMAMLIIARYYQGSLRIRYTGFYTILIFLLLAGMYYHQPITQWTLEVLYYNTPEAGI